jgi:hypothetical protein
VSSRATIALAVLLALCCGCAQLRANRVIADVERIRGVRFRSAPKIEGMSRLTHIQALTAAGGGGATGWLYWNMVSYAFGLIRPNDDLEKLYAAYHGENLAGFYQPGERRVVVIDPGADQRTIENLVHEVDHALSHTLMGSPAGTRSPDQLRAASALDEGTALLTQIIYMFRQRGLPLGALWLIRPEYWAAEFEKTLAASYRALPPFYRQLELFRMMSGWRFALDLYLVGGFPLVNRAFTKPPLTSAQILHTDKYLLGAPATSVAYPKAPSNWRVVASGSMGEVGIRAFLTDCGLAAVAAQAATGWAGDAFSVVADSSNRLALLWSTAWDSSEAASAFEEIVRRRARCWSDEGEGFLASRRVAISRDEARVAISRGMSGYASDERIAAELHQLVGVMATPSPPFPDLADAAPRTGGAVVERGTIRHYALALEAKLPFQMPYSWSLEDNDADLDVRSPGNDAIARLKVTWGVSAARLNHRYHSLGKSLFKANPVSRDAPPLQSALGTARGIEMTSPGETRVLRLYHLPVCAGAALLTLTLVAEGVEQLGLLETWLGTLRQTEAVPPICKSERRN